MPEDTALSPQAAYVAAEAPDAGYPTSKPFPALSAADRRLWQLAFRSGQRAERRREVRSELRAAYWAHRSGLGPPPPVQALRAPGRYLSEFVWDQERRCWSCPGELRKSDEQGELERAA